MTQIGRWHWNKLDYVPDLASWVCTHTLRAHVIYFLQSSNKPTLSLHWSAPHSPAPWKTQSDGVCFFQSPPVLKYQCLLPENNLAQLTSHETKKTNMCIAFLNHFSRYNYYLPKFIIKLRMIITEGTLWGNAVVQCQYLCWKHQG